METKRIVQIMNRQGEVLETKLLSISEAIDFAEGKISRIMTSEQTLEFIEKNKLQ